MLLLLLLGRASNTSLTHDGFNPLTFSNGRRVLHQPDNFASGIPPRILDGNTISCRLQESSSIAAVVVVVVFGGGGGRAIVTLMGVIVDDIAIKFACV